MNVLVTVALLPALFAPGSAESEGPVAVRASTDIDTVPVRATAASRARSVPLAPGAEAAAAATTTTTVAPPTTVAPTPRPTATVAPKRLAAAPTTTVKPRPAPTTTVAPRPRPTPTTAPPAPSSSRTESGKASWYDHKPGICAHKTLPLGTVVTVTATASGKSTTCTVGDRGPYIDGWVIDLHPEQFEQLAPRSTGVIAVRLTW